MCFQQEGRAMNNNPAQLYNGSARVPLDGEWTLRHFLEGSKVITKPDDLLAADLTPLPATVPGNVEIDLMAAGEIKDPFFGDNCLQLRPLEFHQWWYERHFPSPSFKNPELVFEGLDCIADIWLNGKKIASTDNAMIPHRVSLRGLLRRPGEDNVLFVCIKSPLNAVRDIAPEPWMNGHSFGIEMLRLRKPSHCFGWDIMPRIVSAGIWRSVYIENRPDTGIDDVYITTRSCSEERARLHVWLHFHTDALVIQDFQVRLRGQCGDSSFELIRTMPFTWDQFQFEVQRPLLWWPRGYGEPNLYDVTVEILHQSQVVAARSLKLGIRTIELERTELNTPEHPGKFRFLVNGVPVFAKGSNWVPADALHSRDAERIPAMLALFADMGCNMVRCWGGNVYEPKLFYDICDREGIMVWQDFSMACGAYPQDEGFLAQMRREAEIVVRDRRQHACIALWAGDNECDSGYVGWFGNYRDPARNRITREVLPQVIDRLDPVRPYLPSSPYISPAIVALKGKDYLGPEQHLWGARDYFKSSFFANNTACFASEIGYHGCPAVSSIKKFISQDRLWPWADNPEWAVHATDPVPGLSGLHTRIELMAKQIREFFADKPDNLRDFALASQIVQAEAKKFFVERFRVQKWRTSGILWWNMIDGWPQFSDAIVDYYFTKKLAYFYLQRVHQDLCIIMAEPEAWNCAIVACNDSRVERRGHCRVMRDESRTMVLDLDFTVPANSNAVIGKIPVRRGDQQLYLLEWESDGVRGVNHYILGLPPFTLNQYKRWLPHIQGINPFDWSSN